MTLPVDSATHCERDDRPKICEIEITPEMVKAGVVELMAYALPDDGPEEYERAVRCTFKRMALLAGVRAVEK